MMKTKILIFILLFVTLLSFGQSNTFKYVIKANGGIEVPVNTFKIGTIMVTRTGTQLNFVDATSSIQTQLNSKANSSNAALTGIPTAPTAAAGTNTTQIATTAFATTADNLKLNVANPTATGTLTTPILKVNGGDASSPTIVSIDSIRSETGLDLRVYDGAQLLDVAPMVLGNINNGVNSIITGDITAGDINSVTLTIGDSDSPTRLKIDSASIIGNDLRFYHNGDTLTIPELYSERVDLATVAVMLADSANGSGADKEWVTGKDYNTDKAGLVPYTGATTAVNLGTNTLTTTGLSTLGDVDIASGYNLYTPVKATGTINAAVGITDAMLSSFMRHSTSAPIDITANPQIADPSTGEGTTIMILGSTDANYLKIDDGDGVYLTGSHSCILGANDYIILNYSSYTGSWVEVTRSEPMSPVGVVKKTIGWDGASGCDFYWAGDANHTAQSLDMGLMVPWKSRVIAVEVVCTETLVGANDITIAAGNATSGEQFIAAVGTSCDVANDVVGIIDATKPATVPMNFAGSSHIYITGDPDANWADMTAGKWSVYVTYVNYGGK